MSEEEAKARRRMQAAQKENQARRLEANRADVQAKQEELDEKIEKLETAKQKVASALSSLSSFSSGLSSLKDTGSGSFKGSRKNEYTKELDNAKKKVSSYKKTQEENKKAIDRKIKVLKEERQRTSMTIGSLNTRIHSLYAAAAQLRA